MILLCKMIGTVSYSTYRIQVAEKHYILWPGQNKKLSNNKIIFFCILVHQLSKCRPLLVLQYTQHYTKECYIKQTISHKE